MNDQWKQLCPLDASIIGVAREREDNLWMVSSGILVLSMNCAFGLLEAGCVRSKNSLNIMMKNLSDMVIGGVVWWLGAYRLAFQLSGDQERWPGKVYDEAAWFFQWTFAATAATIDSGAIAERINFLPYVLLSSFTTGFVYPVAVSWVWAANGYLQRDGFVDFAGSAVVHMLGGTSALICCAVLGPRIGRFPDYKPRGKWWTERVLKRSADPDWYMAPPGHPQIEAVTDPISLVWGVFFLWIGWYGFNTGGVVNIEYAGTYVVGRVTANTTLGALGGGGMSFLIMLVMNRGKIMAEGFALGILSGLVSITGGCVWFGNGDCFLLGMIGSIIAEVTRRIAEWAYLDDVVSAISVHFMPGLFGSIAIAFFAQPWQCSGSGPIGLFYAKEDEMEASWKLLKVQIRGCILIMSWSGSMTLLLLLVINQLPGLNLRLPREAELTGMDETEHDMSHEGEDFQNIVHQYFTDLSTNGNESFESLARRAASHALQRLTIRQQMTEFKKFRVDDAELGTTLIVQDLKVTGLPHVMPKACKPFASKIYIMVELVSASIIDAKKGIYKWDYNYFAPRMTESIAPNADTDSTAFNDTFSFEHFYIPPGTEDNAFVTLTLFVSGTGIGKAFAPCGPGGWSALSDPSEGIESKHDLELRPLTARADALLANTNIQVKLVCPTIAEPRSEEGESSEKISRRKTKSDAILEHLSDGSWHTPDVKSDRNGDSSIDRSPAVNQAVQTLSERLMKLEHVIEGLQKVEDLLQSEATCEHCGRSRVQPHSSRSWPETARQEFQLSLMGPRCAIPFRDPFLHDSLNSWSAPESSPREAEVPQSAVPQVTWAADGDNSGWDGFVRVNEHS